MTNTSGGQPKGLYMNNTGLGAGAVTASYAKTNTYFTGGSQRPRTHLTPTYSQHFRMQANDPGIHVYFNHGSSDIVRHDSTEENMKLLWSYLEKFGRPLLFYTDKASLFQTTEKRRRDEPGVEKEAVDMPPTQIGRALRELGITWCGAHSPQAKGRVERNFGTAQDRLVKGMRVAGVKTIQQANRYLEEEYLVWWERELTVEPASTDDAHRPLEKSHNLAASLSRVEMRQVRNDYTFRFDGDLYQIDRAAIVNGMRGADVRGEQRLDGSLAVRYGERYLAIQRCEPQRYQRGSGPALNHSIDNKSEAKPRPRSNWNRNFDRGKSPKIWQAAKAPAF